MSNLSTISSIAPGNPKIPTNNEVPILSPIWKENAPPIMFIKNIKSPPKTEFRTNFNIDLIGIEKTFPNTSSAIIQPKITKPLEKSKFYHLHSYYKYLW